MSKNVINISADEFLLCATNEGSIYQANMALARYTRELSRVPGFTVDKQRNIKALWLDHVRNVVVPCLTGPQGGYRNYVLAYAPERCAEMLAAHYADTLAEDEAFEKVVAGVERTWGAALD